MLLLHKGLDASQKVVSKAREFRGNQIVDTVLSEIFAIRTNSNNDNIGRQNLLKKWNRWNEKEGKKGKRDEILNKLIKLL